MQLISIQKGKKIIELYYRFGHIEVLKYNMNKCNVDVEHYSTYETLEIERQRIIKELRYLETLKG